MISGSECCRRHDALSHQLCSSTTYCSSICGVEDKEKIPSIPVDRAEIQSRQTWYFACVLEQHVTRTDRLGETGALFYMVRTLMVRICPSKSHKATCASPARSGLGATRPIGCAMKPRMSFVFERVMSRFFVESAIRIHVVDLKR